MDNCTPSYRGYRFPPEIISHAVWLYHVSPNRPSRRFSVRAYSVPNFRHHWRTDS